MRLARSALALCVMGVVGATGGNPQDDGAGPPTICVDLVVVDAKGRPATNLGAEEFLVSQDDVKQRLAALIPQKRPGHYEIRYVPANGKLGRVTVRMFRPGLVPRGPSGPALTPRVAWPLPRLEAELSGLFDSRSDAVDFTVRAAVLHFGSTADDVHHTLIMEIPPNQFTSGGRGPSECRVRPQFFGRVLDSSGRVSHHVAFAEPEPVPCSQAIVWTLQLRLPPGAHTFEGLARDAVTSRVAVRRIAFTVPVVEMRLGMSSLALVQARQSVRLVEGARRTLEDPLRYKGEPLMPVLELTARGVAGDRAEFFSVIYPDQSLREPVSLRVDLLRDGLTVASSPAQPPDRDPDGAIRLRAGISLARRPPGEYALRLVATQGAATVQAVASFTISAAGGP